jgi:hypothetical protein
LMKYGILQNKRKIISKTYVYIYILIYIYINVCICIHLMDEYKVASKTDGNWDLK